MLRPMQRWPAAVLEALREEASVVRVLVASLRGSAPREAGACMLVTRDGIIGTIGGGHLEWKAIAAARLLLPQTAPPARLLRYVLGIELGQCCGGVVELWVERYTAADRLLLEAAAEAMRSTVAVTLVSELGSGELPPLVRTLVTPKKMIPSPSGRGAGVRVSQFGGDPALIRPFGAPSPRGRRNSKVALSRNGSGVTLTERLDDDRAPLWLFGAGHVGQALVRVLSELPLRITWIDSRAELFPPELSESVDTRSPASPVASVDTAAAGTHYVVMTHDHALDYALCRAILLRDDVAYVGLIGSHSKGARFRSRLAREGLSAERIARLVCPIGVDGIASKWPAAIAVSIAAQLLQTLTPPSVESVSTLNCTQECATCQPIP